MLIDQHFTFAFIYKAPLCKLKFNLSMQNLALSSKFETFHYKRKLPWQPKMFPLVKLKYPSAHWLHLVTMTFSLHPHCPLVVHDEIPLVVPTYEHPQSSENTHDEKKNMRLRCSTKWGFSYLETLSIKSPIVLRKNRKNILLEKKSFRRLEVLGVLRV